MNTNIYRLLFICSIMTISCSLLEGYGTEKTFKSVQLFYTDKVTEKEANALGKYLISSGFADDGDSKKTVQLNKSGKTYEFRMVVKKGIDQDQNMIDVFKEFAGELSENVFDGKPVDIHLCDEKLETLRVIVNINN